MDLRAIHLNSNASKFFKVKKKTLFQLTMYLIMMEDHIVIQKEKYPFKA